MWGGHVAACRLLDVRPVLGRQVLHFVGGAHGGRGGVDGGLCRPTKALGGHRVVCGGHAVGHLREKGRGRGACQDCIWVVGGLFWTVGAGWQAEYRLGGVLLSVTPHLYARTPAHVAAPHTHHYRSAVMDEPDGGFILLTLLVTQNYLL